MLRNQVVNCSALDLLTSFPDRSVGAVVTDPPFFVNVGRMENWSQDAGFGQGAMAGEAEVSSVGAAVQWTIPHSRQICRILRPGGAFVVMGGSQSLAAWELANAEVGLSWMAELQVLWNMGKPRARNFGSLSTAIRWYIKPGARHSFNAGSVRSIYSNVLVCKKVPIDRRLHPAQKPVELTNFLVSLLTDAGDTVVDPFCGAGTTLVSAELVGDRVWVGADLEDKYCAIAERRAIHAEFEESHPIYLWLNNKLIEVTA